MIPIKIQKKWINYFSIFSKCPIFQTAMMSEAELAGNDDEDMEDEEGMPFDESEIPQKNEESEEESDDEEDEDEDEDDDDAVGILEYFLKI